MAAYLTCDVKFAKPGMGVADAAVLMSGECGRGSILTTEKEESYQDASLYGDICQESRFYDYRYNYAYNYQHIINQVSLSNVSQLYIRALTHHAVLLCVLLFVFLYCVIVHCCTGMYPTTGTLISVDIKKITYIHHTEFV